MASFKIDQRQLMVELSASDPLLKREAEKAMHEQFFDPAVAALKEEWAAHPVTREIAAGVNAANESATLEAPFKEDGEMDSPANLTSFIGFDQPGEAVLAPILQRLDPRNPEGPQLKYEGRDKNKLTYRYVVSAPSEDAIYAETPIPWAEGLSWAKRIEQGLPGIGHFLNVKGRPASRSGGGIQVEGQLRSGRFRPVPYLSRLFNNFLRRVAGRSDNGRAI